MASTGQIKKIKSLQNALQMDDDVYRLWLSGYGAKSCTKLSIAKADDAIKDLEAKAIAAGVWEKRKPAKPAKARRLADDPQSVMLRAIWIQLHQAGKVKDPSERALCKFAKRMTHKDALEWLSDRDVTVVKKALKDWFER